MTQNFQQVRKASRAWLWLTLGGLAALAAGINLGNSSAGAFCGTPFDPKMKEAIYDFEWLPGFATDVILECRVDVAQNTVFTWLLMIAGAVLAVAGLIIKAAAASHQASAPLAPAAAAVAPPSPPSQHPTAGGNHASKFSYSAPKQVAPAPQSVITGLWVVAGVASIALGSLGITISAFILLPEAADNYGSGFIGAVAGLAGTGSLVAGIMAMTRRWRHSRQVGITVIASAGVVMLTILPAARFGLGFILVSGLAAIAIIAMALSRNLANRGMLQKTKQHH